MTNCMHTVFAMMFVDWKCSRNPAFEKKKIHCSLYAHSSLGLTRCWRTATKTYGHLHQKRSSRWLWLNYNHRAINNAQTICFCFFHLFVWDQQVMDTSVCYCSLHLGWNWSDVWRRQCRELKTPFKCLQCKAIHLFFFINLRNLCENVGFTVKSCQKINGQVK